MATTAITSMTELSARLRADDTPTPPASDPANDHGMSMDTSSPSTPTRHSFAGLLAQRPLPDGLPTSRHDSLSDNHDHHVERADSTQPGLSQDVDDDIDMGDGDAETIGDEDFSDGDSATSEKPSKKKKGQRFFCTEFPPCQLSFTRSEHLARHIRKHTGERPFQCHCSRRFSRLDNLRQHAQTVHVNEEIPGDSLAATSTRFQRQIRTDRVRPSSSRSRGSTINGQQAPVHSRSATIGSSQDFAHSRGHSRNVSASSIGSVTSNSIMPDDRRRPPTLAIATEGLKRPHDMTDDESQYYSQGGNVTTPTSSFSTNIGSPSYHNNYISPRSSYYGAPAHNRRLSVPASSNSYKPQHVGYAPGYYTPISSQASAYGSQQTSGYASPTSSIVSPGRHDFESEIEYRRRTWHPSSQSSYNQRPPTSGLSYQQTPDYPVPSLSLQPAANQLPKLPGIESFDHAPPAAARPQADTLMLNAMSRPTTSHESGIQQGFNRLEITSNGPPTEPQWQQALGPPPPQQYAQANAYQHQHHISMPDVPVTSRRNKRQAWYGGPVGPSSALLQPQSQSHRPSPEDSGSSDGGVSTPLTFQGQEYHPVIANLNEPVAAQAEQYRQVPLPPQHNMSASYAKPIMPPRADSGFGPSLQAPGPMTALSQQMPHPQPYPMQAGHDARFANGYMQVRPERADNDMGRLEALVAVATSENRVAEKQR